MNAPDKSWLLITGASSGFGEEFARQYAAQGHSLVLVARRLDRLQKLAEALRQQFHIEVVVEQVDLSDIAETGSRRSRRSSRIAGRTHERRARLGQQGHCDLYVGNAAMAAPSRYVANDECMNRNV